MTALALALHILGATGLGLGEDRIFMVSVMDSHGFSALLDTEKMEEAELIRRLVDEAPPRQAQ